MTPATYVRARRLVRARELLSATRSPIAEIALLCGFSSQSHLTTAFRQDTGATPAAFRRDWSE